MHLRLLNMDSFPFLKNGWKPLCEDVSVDRYRGIEIKDKSPAPNPQAPSFFMLCMKTLPLLLEKKIGEQLWLQNFAQKKKILWRAVQLGKKS